MVKQGANSSVSKNVFVFIQLPWLRNWDTIIIPYSPHTILNNPWRRQIHKIPKIWMHIDAIRILRDKCPRKCRSYMIPWHLHNLKRWILCIDNIRTFGSKEFQPSVKAQQIFSWYLILSYIRERFLSSTCMQRVQLWEMTWSYDLKLVKNNLVRVNAQPSQERWTQWLFLCFGCTRVELPGLLVM